MSPFALNDGTKAMVAGPFGARSVGRSELDGLLTLEQGVGRTANNPRRDVELVEILLGANGYLNPDDARGPTGYFGQRVEQAIKRFQKDKGLSADGRIDPAGETLRSLKNGLITLVDDNPKDGGDDAPEDESDGWEPKEPNLLEKILTWISSWINRSKEPPPLPRGPLPGGLRG